MSRLMNIPEGWTSSTLGEQTDILCGKAFSSSEYVEPEHGTLLLRGDNIGQGFLRWRDAKAWPEQENENLDKYHLREGDIVLAMDRPWIPAGLKVSEVSERDLPSLLVQRVARLRAKNGFSQSLVKQILLGHQFVEYVKGSKTESAVPHISAKDIKEFPIAVPTEVEQQKIVEILSDCDSAIGHLEEKLSSLRKIVAAKVETYIWNNNIPRTELSNCCNLVNDKILPVNLPLHTKCIELEHIDGESRGTLNGFSSPETLSSQKTKFKKGDVLFGKLRPYLRKFAHADFDGVCSTEIWALRAVSEKILEEYLFYLMSSKRIFAEANKSFGSKMPRADWGLLSNLPVPVPTLEMQNQIAQVINSHLQEISQTNQSLQQHKKQKRGLMQQLLTGKLRVKGAA